MEPGADRRRRPGAFSFVTLEVGPDGDRPGDEQLDRLVLGHGLGGESPARSLVRFSFWRSDSARRSRGTGRPGTGYSCSPDTRSAARLVAITAQVRRRPEQVGDDRRGLDHLLEVVEDEQHVPLGQPLDELVARRLRPPSPTRPNVVAILDATRPGSRTGSSGHEPVPSAYSWATLAASCSDRRVLPVPPGPVSVSRRVVASSSAPPASSASRPTKLVSCVGRLFGRLSSERIGGKSAWRPSIDELADLLRPEVLEPVLAEAPQS